MARRQGSFNLTAVSIMANTNTQPKSQSEMEQKHQELLELFKTKLTQEDAANEVFGHYPWVEKLKFTSFGIEVGGKYKRLHTHLTVEIFHSVPKYSLSKLRSRLKKWLNVNYGKDKGIRNWNLWTTLQPRYMENYANKETRWQRNDEINKIKSAEKSRLEDERSMKTILSGMKALRVLDTKEVVAEDHRLYNKVNEK